MKGGLVVNIIPNYKIGRRAANYFGSAKTGWQRLTRSGMGGIANEFFAGGGGGGGSGSPPRWLDLEKTDRRDCARFFSPQEKIPSSMEIVDSRNEMQPPLETGRSARVS